MKISEDDLCRAFADKAKASSEFAAWVLKNTKFRDEAHLARLLHEEQAQRRKKPENWWRHWWCPLPEPHGERETDVFLVFENLETKKRFALHIENKPSWGSFEDGQAEAYEFRARHKMKNKDWLNYTEFSTVLIAPLMFRAANQEKSNLFHCYISYESVAKFVPEFKL